MYEQLSSFHIKRLSRVGGVKVYQQLAMVGDSNCKARGVKITF